MAPQRFEAPVFISAASPMAATPSPAEWAPSAAAASEAEPSSRSADRDSDGAGASIVKVTPVQSDSRTAICGNGGGARRGARSAQAESARRFWRLRLAESPEDAGGGACDSETESDSDSPAESDSD